jgi:hypothetical protein
MKLGWETIYLNGRGAHAYAVLMLYAPVIDNEVYGYKKVNRESRNGTAGECAGSLTHTRQCAPVGAGFDHQSAGRRALSHAVEYRWLKMQRKS